VRAAMRNKILTARVRAAKRKSNHNRSVGQRVNFG
jgi:hypothetical protein